jgi:Tfp pilus assembly protein PilX
MTTPTTQRPRRLAALRSQEGITMIVTMGVMVVTSLLLAATFTLARSEIHLTSTDTAEKKAYYAAEAGIEDYEDHLTQDGNYLSYCTDPPTPNPALNQIGETVHRATIPSTIPGEATDEQYAIQLLPAESHPADDRQCDPNRLVETMLEEKGAATGTFRIESTGYSGNTERSIVATFKNANFVSFVWYTKYETGDPSLYGEPPASELNRYTQCGQFYGERPGSPCSEFDNYFISGESVKGPMHTEDHAGICGNPVFGRNSSDRIEFRSEGLHGDEGFSGESYCPGGSNPTFAGSHILPNEVPSIEPPPGDEELKHIVEPAYLYEDKTEIILEGSTMTVKKHVGVTTGPDKETTETAVPFPSNGVIYVEGGCSKAYSPFGPVPNYNEDSGCGNVYVHGHYTESLTIASENDIVINGNITTPVNAEGTPTSNALLGLIANNFVRVFHPVVGGPRGPHFYYDCNGAGDSPEDLKEPTIYAAILAVKHAVIVDNFDCGAPSLGHLNIYGAVAGLFSNGMTGVFSGSSIVAGYPYDANYDDRLQIEEPPHFLNPVQAAWYVQRQTLVPNPTP